MWRYRITVTKLLLRSVRPGIVDVGDGVMDWHVSPALGYPTGRYRVVYIDDLSVWADYEGVIDDTEHEVAPWV